MHTLLSNEKRTNIYISYFWYILFLLYSLYTHTTHSMCHLYLIPIELQSSDVEYLYYTYTYNVARVCIQKKRDGKKSSSSKAYTVCCRKNDEENRIRYIQHCHYLTTCFVLCAFPSCSYHNANCTSYTPEQLMLSFASIFGYISQLKPMFHAKKTQTVHCILQTLMFLLLLVILFFSLYKYTTHAQTRTLIHSFIH